MRIRSYYLLALVTCQLASASIQAQTNGGPTDKKAETPPTPREIAGFRASIEADPDNLDMHHQYIKAVGIDGPEFKTQYDAWIKKFPQSVTVVFAIAEAYYNKERAEATPYLLKVVEMDPRRGDVYEMLAVDACRWGDYPANARYEKLATETDPSNFDYARHYALALKGRDHGEWKDLCRDLERRFAGTDNGAQALGLIGVFSDDFKEKEAIFLEQIRKYPADKFPSTRNSVAWLASLYVATAPEKARELYNSLMADTSLSKSTKDYYRRNLNYAEAFISGQELISKGQYQEALNVLSNVKVTRSDNVEATSRLALMKAEALDRAGSTDEAYDSLLKGLSLKPSDDLLNAAMTYGKKLGKSDKDIGADRWKLLEAASKPAPDFDLFAYLQKKNISLSGLKGKTIFLTFWFPGCGPCRVEMLHLEPVVKKIKDRNFVYLGINGLTDQDPYVESFMRKTGFSFTPLRDDGEKVAKSYGVRGYPTNFIIDPNGKIVYSGFMISNPKDERMLELMIRSVLDHKF